VIVPVGPLVSPASQDALAVVLEVDDVDELEEVDVGVVEPDTVQATPSALMNVDMVTRLGPPPGAWPGHWTTTVTRLYASGSVSTATQVTYR
jgi:hypothetical protein